MDGKASTGGTIGVDGTVETMMKNQHRIAALERKMEYAKSLLGKIEKSLDNKDRLKKSRANEKGTEDISSIRPELRSKPMMPWMGIPEFDGEDAENWVLRVEQYFELGNLTEDEKLKAVRMCFIDDALLWYRWERDRNPNPFLNWEQMKRRVLAQYGADQDTSAGERLLMLRQEVSVKEKNGPSTQKTKVPVFVSEPTKDVVVSQKLTEGDDLLVPLEIVCPKEQSVEQKRTNHERWMSCLDRIEKFLLPEERKKQNLDVEEKENTSPVCEEELSEIVNSEIKETHQQEEERQSETEMDRTVCQVIDEMAQEGKNVAKKRKKKRWKNLSDEKGKTSLGCEGIKNGCGYNQREAKHLREEEKQRDAIEDTYAFQVLDKKSMVQERATRKRKKKKKFKGAKRSKYKCGKVNHMTRQTQEEYKSRELNNKSLMQRCKIVNYLASHSHQVTGERLLSKFTKKKKKRTRLEEHERESIKPTKYGNHSEKEGIKHELVYAKLFVVHKTVLKKLSRWKKHKFKQKHNKQQEKIKTRLSRYKLTGLVLQKRKKLSAKMSAYAYKEVANNRVRRKRDVEYGQFRRCKCKPWEGEQLNFQSHVKRDFKNQRMKRMKGCKRVKGCCIVLDELLLWESRVKKEKSKEDAYAQSKKRKHTTMVLLFYELYYAGFGYESGKIFLEWSNYQQEAHVLESFRHSRVTLLTRPIIGELECQRQAWEPLVMAMKLSCLRGETTATSTQKICLLGLIFPMGEKKKHEQTEESCRPSRRKVSQDQQHHQEEATRHSCNACTTWESSSSGHTSYAGRPCRVVGTMGRTTRELKASGYTVFLHVNLEDKVKFKGGSIDRGSGLKWLNRLSSI